MEATGTVEAVPKEPKAASPSGRLFGLASDERLVRRVRAGSEEAFAVLYERHHRKLLSYCRHMLGSLEEAEDALQQAFANAYRDMLRGEKELRVRPWLYRIAHNQCISMLRARRAEAELPEDAPSLGGLSEEVARRNDLRELLADLASLPPDQREALVLAELHDNSHAEVAEILGCEREKVKSLVFQARSSLLKSREAREISCLEVQRQLSVLRGGSLRRSVLRRHLSGCAACRRYHEEVRRQRSALALVLPVLPSAGLKFGAASALAAGKAAAASLGGSGATSGIAVGTAASAGAGGSAGTSGSLTALAAKLGASGTALKTTVAAVAVTTAVAGGTAGVQVARHQAASDRGPGTAFEHRAAGRDLDEAGSEEAAPGLGPKRARQSLTPAQIRAIARRQLHGLAVAIGAPSLFGHRRGRSGVPGLGRPGSYRDPRSGAEGRKLGQRHRQGVSGQRSGSRAPLRKHRTAPLGGREGARRPSLEGRSGGGSLLRRRRAARQRHAPAETPAGGTRDRSGVLLSP